MAKLVQPLMSLEARGKMGGLIYNTWRGIATVKSFASPSQPNTAGQLAARARLASVSGAWSILSDTERAAWTSYADAHLESDWTGNPKRLTAQNWFVRCNTRIDLVGGAAITSPPASAPPASPTGLLVAYAGGPPAEISATWISPVAATSYLVFYSNGPISAGTAPRFEQAAVVAKIAADTATPQTVISAPASGKYGIWCQVIDSLTGLASQPLLKEVVVP